MKVIILDCQNKEEIINHFIAYGFDKLVVFGREEKIGEHYRYNGIKVISVNSFSTEGTAEKLLKIKGSLNERFVIVYSKRVCDFDLDELLACHMKSQCMVTLLQREKHLCAVVCEEETAEYVASCMSFEKETILRIGEEAELQLLE